MSGESFASLSGLLAEDVADQREVALRVVDRADLALELRVEQVAPALQAAGQHGVVPRDADRAVVPRDAGAGAVGLDPEVALVALEVRVQVLHVRNLLGIERRQQPELAVQRLVALVVGDEVVAALAVGGDQLGLDIVVRGDVRRLQLDVVRRPSSPSSGRAGRSPPRTGSRSFPPTLPSPWMPGVGPAAAVDVAGGAAVVAPPASPVVAPSSLPPHAANRAGVAPMVTSVSPLRRRNSRRRSPRGP